MHYRRLGHSGLKVSAVGLGTYLTYGDALDEKASRACIVKAFESGVNFFDTADGYAGGKAETLLGKVVAELGRRHCVLATKYFFPMSEDPNDRGLSRKHLVESVHQSLRRLQTDALDLVQCHRFDDETPVEETVCALEDLMRQGKLLYWGVSRWSAGQLEAGVRASSLGRGPISCQSPYNLLYRGVEQEELPACARLKLGFLAYAPLAQGVLTGKYNRAEPSWETRAQRHAKGMYQLTPEQLAKVERLVPVAENAGLSVAQLALAWVLRRPEVASALVGATRPEQVVENVAAATRTLTSDVVQAVEEALQLKESDRARV